MSEPASVDWDDYERPLVLHPGDIVVVRNNRVTLTAAEAEMVRSRFRKYKVEAIVMGADWDLVREQARSSSDTTKEGN